MCLNFYHKRRSQTWKIAYVKGEGIFGCYHFGQNGSGVLCLWRITDQVCLGNKRLFPASMSCVKAFRSTFRATSFQDLHWLQKLGSCKASFGAKVVSYVGAFNTWQALLWHFTKPFPKPWYWDQPRKTLKRETVLNLSLVKNYQVSKRKCR